MCVKLTTILLNAHVFALQATTSQNLASEQHIIDSWLQPIPSDASLSYCQAYVDATNIPPLKPCVCCGRSFLSSKLTVPFSFSFDATLLPEDHPLNILSCSPPFSHTAHPLLPPPSCAFFTISSIISTFRLITLLAACRYLSVGNVILQFGTKRCPSFRQPLPRRTSSGVH